MWNSAGIPSIPAALPEEIDLMAETISDLLGGVYKIIYRIYNIKINKSYELLHYYTDFIKLLYVINNR